MLKYQFLSGKDNFGKFKIAKFHKLQRIICNWSSQDTIYNTHIQHATQSKDLRVMRKIKGGINLYIELQEHTLDQIAARSIRISLDKPVAFSK